MSLAPFMQTLAGDTWLRESYMEYLAGLVAEENTLDRVGADRPFDFQRGKVAMLRRLWERAKALENPKEK